MDATTSVSGPAHRSAPPLTADGSRCDFIASGSFNGTQLNAHKQRPPHRESTDQVSMRDHTVPEAGCWHHHDSGPSAPQLISSTDDMMSRSAKLPRPPVHVVVGMQHTQRSQHSSPTLACATYIRGPRLLLPGRCLRWIAIACDHRTQYGESREGGSKIQGFRLLLLFPPFASNPGSSREQSRWTSPADVPMQG